MVQVPAPVRCVCPTLNVHWPNAEKLTDSPDVEVAPTVADLAAGDDPELRKAIQLLTP